MASTSKGFHRAQTQPSDGSWPRGEESKLQPSEQEESRTERLARRALEALEAAREAREGKPLPRTRSLPTNLQQDEAKDSIPTHQSFLFKLRQQDAAFRRISVTIPEGCQGPRGVRVNVNVDGRAYNIQAPHAVKAGDTMVVHVPKALPLCTRERDDILQELRRPMKSRAQIKAARSLPSQRAGDTSNCDAYSDENIRERLHQYKALQGRSMEPGVKSILEETEPLCPPPSGKKRQPPSFGSTTVTDSTDSQHRSSLGEKKAHAASGASASEQSPFARAGRCCSTVANVLGRPRPDSPRHAQSPRTSATNPPAVPAHG